MKSLVTYINEASSKYINKLRKFLEPAFKSRPDLFINPDVFYPIGIGSIQELVTTKKVLDSDSTTKKSTGPLIGVGKYNGELYVVVKEFSDSTDTYKLAILDEGSAMGDHIKLINNGSAWMSGHVLNVRPVSIAMKVVDQIDATPQFEGEMNVELFSINWTEYNRIYPRNKMWGGNMDELRSILLKRKTIISELEEWCDELFGKVTWYAKNTDVVKTVRKKPLRDEVKKFADQMLKLYNKIKTRESITEQEMREYKYFFETLYLNVEQVKGTRNKNIIMSGAHITDTALEIPWVIDEPYRIYGQYGSEAPSFKMETKCPTFLSLLKVLYPEK